MDPFVVVSFGKKVFRTRVIRHSLNPTWDEKLLFHVRRHESTFTVQFAVLDWDKVNLKRRRSRQAELCIVVGFGQRHGRDLHSPSQSARGRCARSRF